MGRNNITVSLQNVSRWSGWFATGDTSCTNDSINFLKIDNITLYTEGYACGTISINIIECDFENDYIHVSNDMSKQYIYRYLI